MARIITNSSSLGNHKQSKSPSTNFAMFGTANNSIAIFGMTADLEVKDFVFMLRIHPFTLSDESTIVRLRKLATLDRSAICKFKDERVLIHVRVYPF